MASDEKDELIDSVIRKGSSRGLDFVKLNELRKRAGVSDEDVVIWSLSELIANALDKDYANTIKVEVQNDENNEGFVAITVCDNGSRKLELNDLELILDFESKASSKRGILRVSRGMLGNALKTIFGYSYALNDKIHPHIEVQSLDKRFEISLLPDIVRERIDHEITTHQRHDDGFTAIAVSLFSEAKTDKIKDFLEATTFVNPDRQFEFKVTGNAWSVAPRQKNPMRSRKETSPLWYTLDQFSELFKEFRKSAPDWKLSKFIELFRGFAGYEAISKVTKNVQDAILRIKIPETQNCAILATTKLRDIPDDIISPFYFEMKSNSQPLGTRNIPSVLGSVGKESFMELARVKGWELRSYRCSQAMKRNCGEETHHADRICSSPDHVEYPMLFELAVFYRPEDREGIKVYSCLNFAAFTDNNLFENQYDISKHVALYGKGTQSPVTIVAHAITPVVSWLNYGKTSME